MAERDRFWMCPPRFYGIAYVINPWMQGNVGRAHRQTAERQEEPRHAVFEGEGDAPIKLADRGLMGATGLVTDVGLFLNLLDASLAQASAEGPDAIARDD